MNASRETVYCADNCRGIRPDLLSWELGDHRTCATCGRVWEKYADCRAEVVSGPVVLPFRRKEPR